MSAPQPVLSIEEKFNLAAKDKENANDAAGLDFAGRVEALYYLANSSETPKLLTQFRNAIVGEIHTVRTVPYAGMAEKAVDRIVNWSGLLDRLITDARDKPHSSYVGGADQYAALSRTLLTGAEEILGDISRKKISPTLTEDMREAASRMLQLGIAVRKKALRGDTLTSRRDM